MSSTIWLSIFSGSSEVLIRSFRLLFSMAARRAKIPMSCALSVLGRRLLGAKFAERGHLIGECQIQIRKHRFELVQVQTLQLERCTEHDALAFDAIRGVHQGSRVEHQKLSEQGRGCGIVDRGEADVDLRHEHGRCHTQRHDWPIGAHRQQVRAVFCPLEAPFEPEQVALEILARLNHVAFSVPRIGAPSLLARTETKSSGGGASGWMVTCSRPYWLFKHSATSRQTTVPWWPRARVT